MPMPPPEAKQGKKPFIAAIFFILSLLVGLGTLQLAIASLSLGGAAASSGLPGFGMLGGLGIALGILLLLGLVGAVLSAVACFLRKMYWRGIIGAVIQPVGGHLLFGRIGSISFFTSKKDVS